MEMRSTDEPRRLSEMSMRIASGMAVRVPASGIPRGPFETLCPVSPVEAISRVAYDLQSQKSLRKP